MVKHQLNVKLNYKPLTANIWILVVWYQELESTQPFLEIYYKAAYSTENSLRRFLFVHPKSFGSHKVEALLLPIVMSQ